MITAPLRLASFPTIAIPLLFAATLPYNGVGHSLHWLSFAGIVLLVWLSSSMAKMDLAHAPISWGWLPPLALGYVVWLLINPLVSTYPYISSTTAMQLALLPLALLGWLILRDDDKHETWRVTWALLLLAGVVLAIWGIVDFLVLSTLAHGPLIDANAYAALINLFLIPTAFAYLRTPPSGRGTENPRLQLFVIGMLSLALYMSFSRGGLVSLLAILPALLWLNRRFPMFRRRAAYLLMVLVAAYAVTKTIPLGAAKNIETLLLTPGQQIEHDSSIRARFMMWKATWKIIEDTNPLVGTGLGTYKNYYASYRETRETISSGNLAHNDYLQALQEGGVIQLAFLLALAVFTPVLFLYKILRSPTKRDPPDISDSSAGLSLGVIAISLHALVNFTHYVAPITLLTGLYLARSWETIQPRREMRLLPFAAERVKPGFLKAVVIVLLAAPVSVLAVDGIIFKLFSTKEPLIAQLAPHQRFAITNMALAMRPGNPRPRTFLIQNLLDAASQTTAPEVRKQLLAQAETESKALSRTAPALASGRFFLGKTRVIRGTPEDLLAARDDLERAVELVPPSMGMRLELVKLYRKLGLEQQAYKTIREAKNWYMHEVDYASLAAFAKEAQAVARSQEDRDEAEFWKWVYSRLADLNRRG